MSTDEDPVAWLRKEIGDDLAFARAVSAYPMPGTDFEATSERAARCEAELAILDEHASDGDTIDPECVRCAANHPYLCECGELDGRHWRTAESYPCRTVRLLLSGYRHRPGYREEWVPTPG